MPSSSLNPLIFRDNNEWLRYVLLAGAVGMGVLVFNSLTGEDHDVGTIIGGTLGVLLLAFSGYVLEVRHLVVDPARLEISVIRKDLAKTVTDRFGFTDVRKLLVQLAYGHDEELSPAHRQKPRWSILFLLKDRSVPVTIRPYASKDQATHDAQRIQELVRVEISDNLEEGLNQLAQTGRTIDAVIMARPQLGMTLVQAKEYIDQMVNNGASSPSHEIKQDHHPH